MPIHLNMPMLRLLRHLAHLAPGVGEEFQRPRRGDRRILLPQRAGGEVARVGGHLDAGLLGALVEADEILAEDVDLAADLADGGDVLALQLVRDVGDGAHVGGDVFAGGAVAARRAAHQFAFFVAQRQRQTVDLRFRDDRRHLVVGKPQETPHAIDEVRHVLVAEGVAEREHRHRMLHLCKASGWRRSNFLRRRVLRHQVRKPRLDRAGANTQRVVRRIRHRRRIVLVVALVVLGELGDELLQLRFRLRGTELVDGDFTGIFGCHCLVTAGLVPAIHVFSAGI